MSTQPVRTLVVDDEAGIRFFLEETLQRAGHTVLTASNGEEALDRLRESAYDLVMLDLKLGGRIDGLRVLEAVKWRWPETTVIILTAHGSLESAMAAIREGVDGYLLKPVKPEEVRLATQEALAQRKRLAAARGNPGERPNEAILQRGPFHVDLQKYMVTMDEIALDLTPNEFNLLVHLMQNDHRVVSPQELVQVVREYKSQDLYEARQIIKWYIHRLRRKVEPDPANPRYIVSARGVGYRFRE